jgi:hypothetical protein
MHFIKYIQKYKTPTCFGTGVPSSIYMLLIPEEQTGEAWELWKKRCSFENREALIGKWAAIAQSVYRLATSWTVRGSNPGGSEIFRSRPDRPWGPSSLLYNGYRVSFPGVKWPGRGIDHPPPSSSEVKERVELYLYSPSGPSWPVLGKALPLLWLEKYCQSLSLSG